MPIKCGYCEYVMPKAMANTYLKNRGGEDKKMRPQDYLKKVVNEDFGLKNYCTRVIIN